MPKFRVRRQVDAWVTYVAEVSAKDASEAAALARDSDDELDWKEEGSIEFDARQFVALDADGFEIDGTQTGDF